MGLGRALKKMGKSVIKTASKSVSGVVKGTVGMAGAVGSQITTDIRRGGNILSGLATGNTDKVMSNIKDYGSDTFSNAKAFYGGQAQAAAGGVNSLVGAATFGQGPQISSDGGFLGDTRNSMQKERDQASADAKAEEARLAQEEADRPEKERQSLLNNQRQNQLLKGGGRGYNSLLGGGY